MRTESENVEFKSQLTDDLYKEIIAFANTEGGTVYVGVSDSGLEEGLTHADEAYTRITNGVRDAIAPDVTMFVHYTLQENNVVRITVSEGSNKPYYLKSRGLKPSGVYVRQGASSAPASPDAIRQMIKASDGDQYESLRSLNQELTFRATADAFHKYGVAFGPEKYRALGITQDDSGLYANLALIVSDQCAHTVKAAVFADEANTVFVDQKEFTGSVFTQMEETFRYLQLCNKTSAVFKGLERVETTDYPEEAVREALLNALVHRDYSFSGSVIINVNSRELECISIGGLLPGLSEEDIRAGISQPRNPKLAAIFHRLRLIESYGTGIRRIFALYAGFPVQPRIEVTPNTFKIVLPNRNAFHSDDIAEEPQTERLSPQMQRILAFVHEKGQITEPDIQTLLHLKKTRAYVLARQMIELGLLKQVGRGQAKYYTAAE